MHAAETGRPADCSRPAALFKLSEDTLTKARYWKMFVLTPPAADLPTASAVAPGRSLGSGRMTQKMGEARGVSDPPNGQRTQEYFDLYLISFNDRVATGFLTIFSNYG